MKPECKAFPVEHFQGDALRIDSRKISWNEQAVSYNPDAALALDDVIEQLGDKYGYVFVIDHGTRQLFPGEVVADGYRHGARPETFLTNKARRQTNDYR